MHMNVRNEDIMVCNIFTISESCGPRPPMAIFCFSKARVISADNVSQQGAQNSGHRLLLSRCEV